MNTSLLYNVIDIRAELSISVEFCLAIRYFYLFYLFCGCFFFVFSFSTSCVLDSSLLFKVTILSSILKFCDITVVEYELHTQVL